MRLVIHEGPVVVAVSLIKACSTSVRNESKRVAAMGIIGESRKLRYLLIGLFARELKKHLPEDGVGVRSEWEEAREGGRSKPARSAEGEGSST